MFRNKKITFSQRGRQIHRQCRLRLGFRLQIRIQADQRTYQDYPKTRLKKKKKKTILPIHRISTIKRRCYLSHVLGKDSTRSIFLSFNMVAIFKFFKIFFIGNLFMDIILHNFTKKIRVMKFVKFNDKHSHS